MQTLTGSGQSNNTNTRVALREALRQASERLAGRKPSLGFLFAAPQHGLDQSLAQVSQAAGCPVIGCSTAGELTERGVTKGGVSLMLVASATWVVDPAMAAGLKQNVTGVARRLTARFAETAADASTRGLSQCTSVVLMDCMSGMGERLLRELMQKTRPFQQMVGGGAGDNGAFVSTRVGLGAEAAADAASILHIFSERRWGVGIGHGLRPASERMTVTRAEGPIVYRIDDRPALDVYHDHARKQGIALTADQISPFMLKNELGIYFLDELRTARAPLSVREDGSLVCAAEVPQGSTVCILSGDPEAMIRGATEAAREARTNLDKTEAAGVLVIECIARGMVLGEKFSHAIAAVRQVFPGTPVAGFVSYGEIARFRGRAEGWHNSSVVIAALPA